MAQTYIKLQGSKKSRLFSCEICIHFQHGIIEWILGVKWYTLTQCDLKTNGPHRFICLNA